MDQSGLCKGIVHKVLNGENVTPRTAKRISDATNGEVTTINIRPSRALQNQKV